MEVTAFAGRFESTNSATASAENQKVMAVIHFKFEAASTGDWLQFVSPIWKSVTTKWVFDIWSEPDETPPCS